MQKIRIDKWLWAVRFFKTRTMATDTCTSGKVKIDGNAVKPSYIIKVGQSIQLNHQGIKKTILVKQLIEKRVSAPLAAECYEDNTPEEEKAISKMPASFYEIREKGIGRPTKKDRREIDKFKDDADFS
ncbi:MAG: RNA-binding S4 domain-containing protein [Bacteroidetes bacterium]|nr:RNA-binding S4 domain-containing protein [Bacteroidota bacterium]